jgi:hypothetical protein
MENHVELNKVLEIQALQAIKINKGGTVIRYDKIG